MNFQWFFASKMCMYIYIYLKMKILDFVILGCVSFW